MIISFKLEGLNQLKRSLKKQVKDLKDMQGFFRTVGRHMRDVTVKDRFENERAPDGTPWVPWSGSYKRQLARWNHGKKGKRSGKLGKLGNKILQDTGRLRRSIQYEAYSDKAIIGTNVVYARAHQFGVLKRNLPARPFMGVNENDKKWILDTLGKYIFNRNFGRVR